MITIGTRGSRLALVQAHWVADQLIGAGRACEIKIIKTKGDVIQDRFDKIEGKGFFTKELEDALLAQRIDLAVHSLKDLPTEAIPGLSITAIPQREDPRDLLISIEPLALNEAGFPILKGLRIGTSSIRRVQGLARWATDCEFLPFRGNVPTRIEKLAAGEADAIVLAKAGIDRLGLDLESLSAYPLEAPFLTPAPGQGALALQTRSDFRGDLAFLHHPLTAACVEAERHVLKGLAGGCQLPLGVWIRPSHNAYRLDLFLGSTTTDGHFTVFNETGADPQALARGALTRVLAVAGTADQSRISRS